MKKYDILYIGPMPPPIGGVSIHIQRLAELLSDIFTIRYIDESPVRKAGIFNLRTLNVLQYVALIYSAHTIHIHSEIRLRIFHLVFCWLFHKDTIVTIHSFANNLNPLMKKVHHLLLKRCRRIIIVNPDFQSKIGSGFNIVRKEAFIFPDIKVEPALPGYLIETIEQARQRNCKILINNAWRLDLYQGKDLYGIDLCIELSRKLKSQNLDFLFIFIVPDRNKNIKILEDYEDQIQNYGLSGSFMFVFESISFVRLIERSDIVFRTTISDGDALTIREALCLKKPVIASNVTNRPAGTVLFRSRDVDDLFDKTMLILQQDVAQDQRQNSCGNNDEYLKFYQALYTR